MEYLFGQLGPAVQVVSPPKHTSPGYEFWCREGRMTESFHDVQQQFSKIQNIGILPTPVYSLIQSTAPCLKGAGPGFPHVPQDELAGKTTGLAEQGALAGTQEKKEGLPPTEDRAGDSRGVQRSR